MLHRLEDSSPPAEAIATADLKQRPQRKPDIAAENKALLALSAVLAGEPDQFWQELALQAMALTGASSAGVALFDEAQLEAPLVAVSGVLSGLESQSAGGPSPWDTVHELGAAQLFRDPPRWCPSLRMQPAVEELLCCPFGAGPRQGSLWVASHGERRFDLEDLRLLGDLAQLAGAGCRLHGVPVRSDARRQEDVEAGALRAAEERQRFALEAAGMIAWEWDLATNTIRRSQSISGLIGEGREVGSREEFMEMVHPEDRGAVQQALRRALEEGASYSAEFRIRHPGRDEELWIADQGRVERDLDGRAVMLRGVVRDITERKRAQEEQRRRSSELQAIMDAVPAIVFLAHDPECRRISGSRRAHEVLRLPLGANLSLTAPIGERPTHFRVLHKGVTLGPDQLPLQSAAQGREVRGYEEEVVFKDGSSVRLYGNATPIRDWRGNIRGAVAAFVEITERVRAEEALISAKEAAEEANRAKSRFLAAASHDLRQPLQALHLYMGLLAERLNGREDGLQRSIQRCLKGLTRLLDDLLDISKLDAGLIAPQPEAVALDELIDWVANDFRLQALEKGIELRVVRCPQATGLSDPTLLGRILSNIVANAVRYTREGRILIGCRRRGGNYRIEIWDTGIGIPQEKIPEIFREFHQLDNDERNSERGTGLGLAIVDRLARLLQHRLEVRSWLGKGSMFAVEVAATSRAGAADVAHQPSVSTPARGCVAVLEDETIVREALRTVLEDWGYYVVAAATPAGLEKALHAAHRLPDVIIADYRLEDGLRGTDAIAGLRDSLGADLPAIVLTGDTSPERIREVAESGYHLLHKPLDVDRLKAMVRLATWPEQAQRSGQNTVISAEPMITTRIESGSPSRQ